MDFSGVQWVSERYSVLATTLTLSRPALGPLLSGYAVMFKGWRWSLWEILWMSAPIFFVMFCALPETR